MQAGSGLPRPFKAAVGSESSAGRSALKPALGPERGPTGPQGGPSASGPALHLCSIGPDSESDDVYMPNTFNFRETVQLADSPGRGV